MPVATRTAAPPKLDEEQHKQFIEKAKALAPQYRTELLRGSVMPGCCLRGDAADGLMSECLLSV